MLVRRFLCINTLVAGSRSCQNLENLACKCRHVIVHRNFMSFPGKGGVKSKKKEYYGRKLVGYSMDQMYSVVSDVENYTSFVPFCKKSDVIVKMATRMRADLEIGFPPVVECYTSDITLQRPTLVRAECTEGKLFNHLQTVWKFSPGVADNQQTCIIDFYVSFEFRSLLHSQLAHFFFNELVRQMENAFIQEVANRYGKASMKARMLKNVHIS